jgi:hypothetical protein
VCGRRGPHCLEGSLQAMSRLREGRRLFLPNPRTCHMCLGWGRLTTWNASNEKGGNVWVRYTHDGRQGHSRKPVNIGSITLFSDRSWCGSISLS